MKKVCVITGTRSEYGLLRWVIDGIDKDVDLQLQLVVTGGHLSLEQGLTYQAIEEDGYHIDEKVEMLLSSGTSVGISKSMGVCAIGMADAFSRLKPDMIVVLGDRYELLPIVSTALVMRIPVAHISGGDVTEGAIDDEIRNAVTMMSTLHFPGVNDSADNIRRMRGNDAHIYTVGEPGLDNFLRLDLWGRQEVARSLNLEVSKKWCLVTLHPETRLSIDENMEMAKMLYLAMCKTEDVQYIITKANADTMGVYINKFWSDVADVNPQKMRLYSSLGQIRYLSFMRYADIVVGNSSSGIVEAPFLGIPVVNIGDRQKGRHVCRNVINCVCSETAISEAFVVALNSERKTDTYWGDGHTSERVVSQIKSYLCG